MDIALQIIYKVWTFLHSQEFLQAFLNNRFFLIFLVVFLTRLKYATYTSLWMSALVNIPGTFLHELMHFLVGGFLNAQPCNFTLFPRRNLDGDYVMGSVAFRNITFYNAVPAALAPLLLLPIGFYLNRYYLPVMDATLFNYVVYVLLQTIIVENAIPSRTDFKVAGKFFSGVILYIVLFCAFLLML
ncbi:MAG: hypothetical protein IJ545_01840 [Alphaproteobacteria bacterium]|nr:hypothetical protein [Alphaproteobacteria bacterium]